jgi:hypothetical protein
MQFNSFIFPAPKASYSEQTFTHSGTSHYHSRFLYKKEEDKILYIKSVKARSKLFIIFFFVILFFTINIYY